MAPYFWAPTDGDKFVLAAPDGSRACFNDPTDGDYVGMTSTTSGFDSPDVETGNQSFVGQDGGYNANFYYGLRPLTLNAQVAGFASVAARNVMLAKIMGATNAMTADGQIIWLPTWGVPNLVAEPDFSHRTTGQAPALWIGTPQGPIGVAPTSILVTNNSKADNFVTVTMPASAVNSGVSIPLGTVYAGQTVSASIVVESGKANQTITAMLEDNLLANGPVTASATIATTTTNRTLTLTWTPGANSPNARLYVYSPSPLAGDVFYLRNAIVSYGATIPTYADGDTAGNWWHGTVGQSTSGNYVLMYTPFRRQQPTRFTGGWVKDVQIQLVSQFAPVFSFSQIVSATGQSITAENYGNYPAFPVVRVLGGTGTPATFTVTNTTTGKSVTINGPAALTAGQFVDIDILNHVAIFGGTTDWSQYINFTTATWPVLAGRATNTWTVTSPLTMFLTYRHSWI